MEEMYLDKEMEEIVTYDTACERIYENMTWDDLEQVFIDGMRSGKFCLSEFWDGLPDGVKEDISDDVFNEIFEMRFDEVMEDEENA